MSESDDISGWGLQVGQSRMADTTQNNTQFNIYEIVCFMNFPLHIF